MKSLVIGASGQLGNWILRILRTKPDQCFGTTWSQEKPHLINLDITNRVQVFSVIREIKPDVIFLTSAMTNVDLCEYNPLVSLNINVAGVKNVVDTTHKSDIKLVYFSTDYVFDGNYGPYYTYDICNPINEYGKHKLAAENYVSIHAKDHLIIRTCGVFCANDKKNFAARLTDSIQKGEKIKVVTDQFGSPTYAPELAKAAIMAATEIDSRRLIHVTNNAVLSRFDFAKKIAKHFNAEDLIEPIKTSEIKQEAKRPMKSGLYCSVEVRSIMRSIDSAITKFVEETRYKQRV